MRGDRARGSLRRPGPDPRRADLGFGRASGRHRPEIRGSGPPAWPGRGFHQPQHPSCLRRGRSLHPAESGRQQRHVQARRYCARRSAAGHGRRRGYAAHPGRDRQVRLCRERNDAAMSEAVAGERRRSDYRLIGGAGEQARKLGLVGADWYKPAVPRSIMKDLMRRQDAAAIRDTALWYALILGAGTLAYLSLGTLWAVPAFLLYGTLYAGPADSRWHEAGHGTAFKTRWMNDLLYQFASFQEMRRPTVWRWSHARHHTDTLVRGRDPEVQAQLPIRPLHLVADMVGLKMA